MRLWKVETASGFAYVQAPSEEMAFAYAEGQYGKGNVTGAQPAKGTQEPAIGSPIIAQTDGGIQVVGRYQGGGNLNSLSAFAASYDGDTFARNLAQNPYYTLGPSKVAGMAAPLGGGGGGDPVPDFGGLGADSSALTGQTDNLPSVFREFLRGQGINPFGSLGGAATKLQNPLQNMIDLAGAMNINPFIPGQPATERSQSAEEFLKQRGLRGISQGASNLVEQMSGVGNVNAQTMQFLQPESIMSEGANATRSAMLAALYKMAPSYAARFGSGAIDRASQMYFDDQQRKGPMQNRGAEEGGFTDDNMMRSIRDMFSTGAFG
tara:strand:+ start:2171 stop:3133 length:963 start_codon:yes stop_codon:yes gene_type:complete